MKNSIFTLFGAILPCNGAPGRSLALGKLDRYVIIDCSSILGLTMSSGRISCGTPTQEIWKINPNHKMLQNQTIFQDKVKD